MNLTKQQEENPLGFSGPRLFLIYFIGDDSTEWIAAGQNMLPSNKSLWHKDYFWAKGAKLVEVMEFQLSYFKS